MSGWHELNGLSGQAEDADAPAHENLAPCGEGG